MHDRHIIPHTQQQFRKLVATTFRVFRENLPRGQTGMATAGEFHTGGLSCSSGHIALRASISCAASDSSMGCVHMICHRSTRVARFAPPREQWEPRCETRFRVQIQEPSRRKSENTKMCSRGATELYIEHGRFPTLLTSASDSDWIRISKIGGERERERGQ